MCKFEVDINMTWQIMTQCSRTYNIEITPCICNMTRSTFTVILLKLLTLVAVMGQGDKPCFRSNTDHPLGPLACCPLSTAIEPWIYLYITKRWSPLYQGMPPHPFSFNLSKYTIYGWPQSWPKVKGQEGEGAERQGQCRGTEGRPRALQGQMVRLRQRTSLHFIDR